MRYVQRQPASAEGKSQMRGEVIDHGFTLDNRGKRSVCADLTKPEGVAIVKVRLHARAACHLFACLPHDVKNSQRCPGKNPVLTL
eukprot:SAG11_NODE_706_length_7651_cov_4.192399_7_plen_85_part_00